MKCPPVSCVGGQKAYMMMMMMMISASKRADKRLLLFFVFQDGRCLRFLRPREVALKTDGGVSEA